MTTKSLFSLSGKSAKGGKGSPPELGVWQGAARGGWGGIRSCRPVL